MKDTEKYQNALDAWNEYLSDSNAPPSFKDWLVAKLTPEPPPPKWECLDNSWPFEDWNIGKTIISYGLTDYSKFPNHFKKVEPAQQEPAPKAEAAQTETSYRKALEVALHYLDEDCPFTAKEKIREALGK